MTRPATLAPGMTWCLSCGLHMALTATGGKCPSCDPDLGNQVSARAADALEAIDAALAPPELDTGWDIARWHPNLEAEDDDDPRPRFAAGTTMSEAARGILSRYAAGDIHVSLHTGVPASAASHDGSWSMSIDLADIDPEMVRLFLGREPLRFIVDHLEITEDLSGGPIAFDASRMSNRVITSRRHWSTWHDGEAYLIESWSYAMDGHDADYAGHVLKAEGQSCGRPFEFLARTATITRT